MKATHVRQLLAFWVLASVAAFITSTGLRAPSAPSELAGGPATQAGSSAPTSSPDVPQSARPTAILTDILSPDMWRSAAAAEHATRLIGLVVPTVSAPTTGAAVPTTTPVATGSTGGTGASGGTSTHQGGSGGTTTVAVRPTATATSGPSGGHGKGHGIGHGSGGGDTSHPGKGHGR